MKAKPFALLVLSVAIGLAAVLSGCRPSTPTVTSELPTSTAIPPTATPPTPTGDEDRHETAFTIPVGEDGVTYRGENVPDMLPEGPAAFAVAPDGSFWIADTAGERLLHYSPEGDALGMVNLAGQVVGIGDLEVTSSAILVLDIAAVVPRVLRLLPDGEVLATYELPEGLRLEDGLSGIAVGGQGEVLVEREGGVFVSQLVDADGNLAPTPLDGYVYHGRLYAVDPAGFITVDNMRVPVATTRGRGTLSLLGVNRDGSFYAVVERVVRSTPTIQVDQTVHHYDTGGELLGIAHVPLVEQYVHVAHGLVVGPDGAVYALITRPDRVEVQRLRLTGESEIK